MLAARVEWAFRAQPSLVNRHSLPHQTVTIGGCPASNFAGQRNFDKSPRNECFASDPAGVALGRFRLGHSFPPLAAALDGGADETGEERVGGGGLGFELGMELHGEEPRMVG